MPEAVECPPEPTRRAWADNARVVAGFAVVLLHVASSAQTDVASFGSAGWWASTVYDSVARWGVTVFVMLSGYLLLDPSRQESPREFYRRRAARILVPLVFWTIFYVTFEVLRSHHFGDPLSAADVLRALLSGHPTAHLWFLYMLIGLYACTPFLRYLMRSAPRADMLWLVRGMLLLAVTSVLLSETYRTPDVFVPFTDLFLPYLPVFVMGYYLGNRARTVDARLCALVVLLCAGGGVVLRYWVRKGAGPLGEDYLVQSLSLNQLPASLAAFELLRRWNRPLVSPAVARKLAELTLGIYLVHRVTITLCAVTGLWVTAGSPAISVPIVAMAVYATSAVLAWGISHVPLLRRII